MTKAELITLIAARAEISVADAGRALDAIEDVTLNAVKAGGAVSLGGLGKIGVKHRAARAGRNPRSGEAMDIPAKTVPVFKPSKALKDAAASSTD